MKIYENGIKIKRSIDSDGKIIIKKVKIDDKLAHRLSDKAIEKTHSLDKCIKNNVIMVSSEIDDGMMPIQIHDIGFIVPKHVKDPLKYVKSCFFSDDYGDKMVAAIDHNFDALKSAIIQLTDLIEANNDLIKSGIIEDDRTFNSIKELMNLVNNTYESREKVSSSDITEDDSTDKNEITKINDNSSISQKKSNCGGRQNKPLPSDFDEKYRLYMNYELTLKDLCEVYNEHSSMIDKWIKRYRIEHGITEHKKSRKKDFVSSLSQRIHDENGEYNEDFINDVENYCLGNITKRDMVSKYKTCYRGINPIIDDIINDVGVRERVKKQFVSDEYYVFNGIDIRTEEVALLYKKYKSGEIDITEVCDVFGIDVKPMYHIISFYELRIKRYNDNIKLSNEIKELFNEYRKKYQPRIIY